MTAPSGEQLFLIIGHVAEAGDDADRAWVDRLLVQLHPYGVDQALDALPTWPESAHLLDLAAKYGGVPVEVLTDDERAEVRAGLAAQHRPQSAP